MSNRRTRRRLKASGQQPYRPEPAIQLLKQHQVQWWKPISAKSVGVVALPALSLFLGVYPFRPMLDVSPSFQPDPSRPFSELFIFTNTGMIDLYDLEVTCVQDWFKDIHGNAADTSSELQRETFAVLRSGGKTSIQCTVATVVEPPVEMVEAIFSIRVNCQILIPIYRDKKHFRFVAIRTANGTIQWTPKST